MSTFLWLTISKRTSWVFSVGLASTSFSILTTPGSSLIERSNSKNESEDSWLGTTSVDIRILKRLSFSLTLSVGFRLDISCCRRFLSPRAVMPSSFRSSLSKSFRTAIVILFLENTAITESSNWFLLNCSETSVYIPLTVWHFVSSHWQVWSIELWTMWSAYYFSAMCACVHVVCHALQYFLSLQDKKHCPPLWLSCAIDSTFSPSHRTRPCLPRSFFPTAKGNTDWNMYRFEMFVCVYVYFIYSRFLFFFRARPLIGQPNLL